MCCYLVLLQPSLITSYVGCLLYLAFDLEIVPFIHLRRSFVKAITAPSPHGYKPYWVVIMLLKLGYSFSCVTAVLFPLGCSEAHDQDQIPNLA